MISHAPTPPPKEGGVPALPNFRDSFLFVRSLFVANYQIWRGNTWGRDVYVGVNHASHLIKEAEFQRSPLWVGSTSYTYIIQS